MLNLSGRGTYGGVAISNLDAVDKAAFTVAVVV